MAGPCIENGDCVDLTLTNNGNLRPDLVLDPSPNNGAVCGPDGLMVQKNRARYVEDLNNEVQGAGVTSGLGAILVDYSTFATNHTPGAIIPITGFSELDYTNTTPWPEVVEFGFQMGVTTWRSRVGWDFSIGLQCSWSGPAALSPVSGLRFPLGLRTGANVFDQAYDSTGEACLGVTMPPMWIRQRTVLAPGETLSLKRLMWASYAGGLGSPDGAEQQNVTILFGGSTYVTAWTQ